MKWTMLIMALIMLLCTAACGQMNQYSTSAPGGAPTPVTPSSPESLGLQAPTDVTVSQQTPTAQERTQTLMSTSQEAAYAFAPAKTSATATSPVYNKVIIPTGTYAPNNLYISYAPRTVASCNLYANLPLWMKTSTSGNIWFYEWYPSGMLDTQYAGYVYSPGWYKRWFFADVPGWHILQYHCNGWSNYAYIYVYGPGGYWVNPNPSPDPVPYPYPYWDSQIAYSYPPTGHTYYSHEWTTSYGN
jgi:hypothetical protein